MIVREKLARKEEKLKMQSMMNENAKQSKRGSKKGGEEVNVEENWMK